MSEMNLFNYLLGFTCSPHCEVTCKSTDKYHHLTVTEHCLLGDCYTYVGWGGGGAREENGMPLEKHLQK